MATQRICENDKHEIKSYPVGEDKRSSCALRFWRLDNLLGWLRLGVDWICEVGCGFGVLARGEYGWGLKVARLGAAGCGGGEGLGCCGGWGIREEEEGAISDSEKAQNEELETFVAGSEEVELAVAHILEKIERFTQLVSELLGSGKAMFQKIGDEFEERMIMVHKEQIEKWQEEIRELRILDASNEEANALLHNARGLLHHAHVDS
ncbi:unnamed protein product [Prunus armeniaca]|uniref:Uncharacterized protein n=1 Tax=Prunus armeniaca TaxID=36596 RepID=A0A6J5U9R6_PRUAR|nr:unnamed protein product [Prunus armeniaca]CAB4302647.1 unnamed protein product [Prunus armeniaca]